MAFEYQSFASLGVNLNRQKYGPLDISNVFSKRADLEYYLTKGTYTDGDHGKVSEYWYKDNINRIVPYPYEGQIIATVYDGVKVFVLKEKEDGTFETANVGDTSAAEAAIAELETALAALESKIGEIPTEEKDGKQEPVAKTIVEYINKKTQGIATDVALETLQNAVDTIEEDYLSSEDIINIITDKGYITKSQVLYSGKFADLQPYSSIGPALALPEYTHLAADPTQYYLKLYKKTQPDTPFITLQAKANNDDPSQLDFVFCYGGDSYIGIITPTVGGVEGCQIALLLRGTCFTNYSNAQMAFSLTDTDYDNFPQLVTEEEFAECTYEITGPIHYFDHVDFRAQENVIERISVNGKAQNVLSKTVDIKIPTKLSEFNNDLPAPTDYTVTVTPRGDAEGDDHSAFKHYIFEQCGKEIGHIDIPKDLVVESGSIGTVTETNKPYTGAVIGDKYIDLKIANQTEHLYIPAKSLVDIYTAQENATQVQLAISDNNEISATLVDGAITTDKLNSEINAFVSTLVDQTVTGTGTMETLLCTLPTPANCTYNSDTYGYEYPNGNEPVSIQIPITTNFTVTTDYKITIIHGSTNYGPVDYTYNPTAGTFTANNSDNDNLNGLGLTLSISENIATISLERTDSGDGWQFCAEPNNDSEYSGTIIEIYAVNTQLGIEKGAQVNKIESITINGDKTPLTIDANKNVDITIPEYEHPEAENTESSNATTLAHGGSFDVVTESFDDQGHRTGTHTETYTLPTVGDGKFTVKGTGYLTGSGSMSANQSSNTTANIDLNTDTKAKIDGAVQVSDLANYITGKSTPIVTNLIANESIDKYNLNEKYLAEQLDEVKFMPNVDELYQLVITDISNGKIIFTENTKSTYSNYYEEHKSDPDVIPEYSIYFDEKVVCHIDQTHNGVDVESSAYIFFSIDDYLYEVVGLDASSDDRDEYTKNNIRYSIYRVPNEVSLGIERGAEVNKIDTVSSNFNINTDRQLQLTSINETTIVHTESTEDEDVSLLDFINNQITNANLANEQHTHQVADIIGLKEYLLSDEGYTEGDVLYEGIPFKDAFGLVQINPTSIVKANTTYYCYIDNQAYIGTSTANQDPGHEQIHFYFDDGKTEAFVLADNSMVNPDTGEVSAIDANFAVVGDGDATPYIDKTFKIVELLPNLNLATKTVATADDLGLVKSTAATEYDEQGNITNADTTINKVNVGTDGTMTVNAISVDKIENNGYTLVLFGGNATK